MMRPKKSLLLVVFSIIFSIQLSAQEGLASYYADRFDGRKTASGEKYNKNAMTAAHRTLPFGSFILVTRLDNNSSVVVKVNDRGPFSPNRIVDLSRKAAKVLGIIDVGIAKVKVELVDNSAPAETTTTDIPSEYNEEFASKGEVPVTIETPQITTSTIEHKAVQLDQTNLYKIEMDASTGSNFGIQVASFSNYSNALNKMSFLKSQSLDNVLINVDKRANGTTIYKIILGTFKDKASAENYYANRVQAYSYDGFVINLSEKLFIAQ